MESDLFGVTTALITGSPDRLRFQLRLEEGALAELAHRFRLPLHSFRDVRVDAARMRGGLMRWWPSRTVSLVFASPVSAAAAGTTTTTSAGSAAGTAPGARILRVRTTVRPADWFAAAMTRVCCSRAFVAQDADSAHTVSWPESASYATVATCPASSGAMDCPPLAQRRACGRELPRALGDQRAGRGPQAHRLAPDRRRHTAASRARVPVSHRCLNSETCTGSFRSARTATARSTASSTRRSVLRR